MPLNSESQKILLQWGKQCLSGSFAPIAGVAPKRAELYYNHVVDSYQTNLERVYPITHEILPNETWKELVVEFMTEGESQTPYYWEMPKAFYEYAKEKRWDQRLNKPYLLELMFFEWIEVEIFMMPDVPVPPYRTNGDLVNEKLVINGEIKLLHFNYPVFHTHPDQLEREKGTYFVVVYRRPDDGEVEFVEVSPLFGLVIEILQGQPLVGHQALAAAVEMFPQLSFDAILPEGEAFFNAMLEHKVILGVAR